VLCKNLALVRSLTVQEINHPLNLYIYTSLPDRSGRNRGIRVRGADELGTDRNQRVPPPTHSSRCKRLESVTGAPLAGAGPLSVTVPVVDCAPPVTLLGFNVTEEADGRTGPGATGSVIVCPLLTCTAVHVLPGATSKKMLHHLLLVPSSERFCYPRHGNGTCTFATSWRRIVDYRHVGTVL
jgi:hypothetical protein